MEHEQHHDPHHAVHHAPKKHDDLAIPLAIVVAGVLIGVAILISSDSSGIAKPLADSIPSREQAGADSDQVPVSLLALRSDDHIFGNPNANVLIIEYSDPECPFCKKFHETRSE